MRFPVRPRGIGARAGFLCLFRLGPHDVDRGGVKIRLDVGSKWSITLAHTYHHPQLWKVWNVEK